MSNKYVGTETARKASTKTPALGEIGFTEAGMFVGDGATVGSALVRTARLDDLATRARTIVITGDSICSFNAGPRNSPGAAGSNLYFQSRGYFVWTQTMLKHPFNILSNAGVGGERTDQIAARFAADVLALNPGWVDIEGGTNDVSQGRTAAAIMANLTAMYDAARKAGVRVIANTITTQIAFSGTQLVAAAASGAGSIAVNATPGSMAGDVLILDKGTANEETVTVASAPAGTPGVTGSYTVTLTANLTKSHVLNAPVYNRTKMRVLSAANALIEAYWRNNPNGILCPLNAVYADPATGGPVPALCLDGVHPSIDGAAVLGKCKADVINGIVGVSALRGAGGETTNLLTNGGMAGTGGTMAGFASSSGQVAAGWTLYAGAGTETVVGSKVARTDGVPGEWQQFVLTGGGGSVVNLQAVSALASGDWAVGDTVWAEVEFQGDGDVVAPSSNGALVNVIVNFAGGAGNLQAMQSSSAGDGASTLWPDDAVYRTNAGPIPTGTTSLQVQVGIRASGTFRIGRVRLVKGAL